MNWKNGCVAILKDKDEPIGTGFVVSSTGIIVTCSHLLRPQPNNTILIRFTANNEMAQAEVIEEWSRGREQEDIAFLKLTSSLPRGVFVLPLISSLPVADRHFRCWGYPSVKDFAGLGADGHTVAQVQQNGHDRLQFSSTQITKGYSGGPLWDKDQRAVIGIVNSGIPHDRLNQPDETGFATPSETLIRLCPELKLITLASQTIAGGQGLTEQYQRILHQLPIGYGTAIRNFLTEYLGTDKEKVPFGGREDDLAKLDTWWQDEQSPSYALLVAEAGRGKSALLVRWATKMMERDDVEVIFVPVSIRFQTNSQTAVFASLAARLSELHGEPLSGYSVHSSAETYHLLCSSLLERRLPDGKQLLIILDGLDEASDWQAGPHLFPPQLPARVKLIASARTHGRKDKQGWLEELHWHKGRAAAFTLPFLSRDGVADVLAQMGNPLDVLASELDVVGTLYHLSEGDPLLVRLYVEQLAGHVAQSGNKKEIASWLRTAKPGLEGYFDGWWRDQRQLWGRNSPLKERVSSDFFNLLATALGPLSRSDIRVLLPNISTWLLEETVESLGRFVIGDGQGQPFTFNHPRLGYYFYDRLDKAERQSWEQHFLVYGQSTLHALRAGELNIQDAPAYVTRHYADHLERARADDTAFDALVSQGWAEAWNALEGTYAGFLNDILKVKQRAVKRQDVGMIIWCVLCQSSVTTLSSNIDSDLLVQAVSHNLLTPRQALIITQQKTSVEEKSKTISALAPHLPQELLTEALTATRAITDERSRAEALSALAPHLPQELLAEVLTAARAITDEESRADALFALAPHLPQELLADALTAAHAITDEESRADTLFALAPHLPQELQPTVWAEALTAAHTLSDERHRISALSALAPHLPQVLQPTVWAEALTAAHAITDERHRASVLSALAPHLPQELLAEVLTAAHAITDEWPRAKALSALAPHLPQALLAEALTAARAFTDEWYRAEALSALAPHLPQALQPTVLAEALTATRAITYEQSRAKALSALAPHLPQGLQPTVLAEALTTARAITYEQSRASALSALAPQFVPLVQQNWFEGYRLWYETVDALAISPRPALLGDLQALMPFTLALTEEDERASAAQKIAQAIITVGKWWP